MPTSDPGAGSRTPLNPSCGELPILQATTDLIQWFVPLLEPAAARLDLLRIQTRLLHDFQLIDTCRYEHASKLLEAVARQLSGWLQQQHRSKPA